MKKNYLHIQKKELLNENWIENSLMIAGFVPIIGEIADFVLICYYVYKKQYLYATLMLVALIPTVGDFLVKPFIRVLKGLTGTSGRLVRSNAIHMEEYLMKNPKMKEQFAKIGEHLYNPKIQKSIDNLSGVTGLKFASKGLEKGLDSLKNLFSKVATKPAGIGKAISTEFKLGTKAPISKGITNYFREESLAKYILKNGKQPSNWLKNWYFVVYKGYASRRRWVKDFIIANKILDFLGLPSFEKFEEKMESDSSFRDYVAQQPWATRMVGQTTTPEDAEKLNATQKTDVTSLLKSIFGVYALKGLAQKIVP